MTLSDAAQTVIDLANKIRAYWAAELPKYHPDYPVISPGEPTAPPPEEKRQLRDLLKSLPTDLIYQLALVMYLGRRDFGTADLPGQFAYLKSTVQKPEFAISQMLEKAPLGEYLADGLARLEMAGIDPDNLPLKTSKPRRRAAAE